MDSPLKAWANQQRGVESAPVAPVSGEVSPRHTLTPEQSAWVSLDPRSPERADNPASWVTDEAAWEKAKAIAKKNWGDYEEPWAVTTAIYRNITGE